MAEVVITDSAKTDIKNSISYIKDILCNQKAASNLSDEIIEEILLLKDNPRSGPYVKDSFLANLGFRFLLIKNYKVYYLINGDEGKEIIQIVRFLHSKMDYETILKNEINTQ